MPGRNARCAKKNKTLDEMPPAAGRKALKRASVDAGLAKIMPGRKARFAGKDPQSQSATKADLLYL
jgi:hypothetical protein